MATCNIDMQQAWVKTNAGGMCFHVKNIDFPGDCPKKVTGMKIELYASDGVTLDATRGITKIDGGSIDTTDSCGNTLAVKIFDRKACNGNANLPNGARWDFGTGGCTVPPFEIDPQIYFIFNKITWNLAPLAGSRMVVTIYYDCTGACTGITGLQDTFELLTP